MYKIGQKIQLWFPREIRTANDGVKEMVISKSVVVTITDEKTGTPYEFAEPGTAGCPLQSLRAITDDGIVYEKHWNRWPVSQTDDFASSWTPTDLDEYMLYWIPREAISVVNACRQVYVTRFVDADGSNLDPTVGDVTKCENHEPPYYHYSNELCFRCRLEKMKRHAL